MNYLIAVLHQKGVWQVSKIQQLIQVIRETTKRWIDIAAIIATIIGAIFGILAYFNGSVVVTDIPSNCDGFLANDPSPDVLTKSITKKEEKEYLKTKINCYRDQIQKNPYSCFKFCWRILYGSSLTIPPRQLYQ